MKRLLTLFASLLISLALSAQGFDIDFLTSSDGLSNSSVNAVFQDSRGIMWFGTWDGLNSWNGRSFKVWKSIQDDPKTISGNVVRDIAEDSKGYLWVCTDRGVDRFDPLTRSFKRYFSDEASSIDSEEPFAIYVDSDDVFVYFDRSGVFRLQGDAFVKVFDSTLEVKRFRMDGIIPVVLAKDGRLYRNNQPVDNDFLVGRYKGNNDYYLDDNVFLEARQEGLYADGECILEGIPILSVYRGAQNIIWAGTDMRGVAVINPAGQFFSTYKDFFGGSAVRCFLEDEYGRVLAGTKGSGIFLMTPECAVVQNITMADRLLSNSVYCVADDGETVWIGTEGTGLNYVEKPGSRVRYLEIPDSLHEFAPSCVYSILPRGKDTLWIGTSGGGLIRTVVGGHMLLEARRFSAEVLGSKVVYSVIDGADGTIWIGTRGGGVRRMYLSDERVEAYATGYDVLALLKTEDGCVWAGTSEGLDRIYPDGAIRHYTEKDGLPNNTVHGIVPDRHNCLWISTNGGLARMDPEDGSISSYYVSDGLQGNEFSDGAYYMGATSGQIYFGGVNGFSRFDPESDGGESYQPPLILDSFSLNNEPAALDDYLRGSSLQLLHQKGTFSFSFIPLDYLNSMRCSIRYRLDGFNRDWVNLGSSGTVVFSNLFPGKYTLHVQCSSSDRKWSDEEFVLPVRIIPRWWESPPAFMLYLVILAVAVYFIMRMRSAREEAKKMKEIHQAKLKFFSDMGYEFSNALTLLSGPSAELQGGRLSSDQKRYLETIESSSGRMQSLVKQLIAAIDDIPRQPVPESRAVYGENEDLTVQDVKSADLLVVDEDAGIRAFIGALLSSQFNVTEASGGKDALEKMAVNQPSLIISALKMTGIDGLEFLSRVRSDKRFSHIPFIMLSANDSMDMKIEALEKGADAYMTKPFNPKHLVAKAANLVGRGEAIKEYGGSARSSVRQLAEKTVKKEDKALIVSITDIILKNIENESLSPEMLAGQAALSKMQLYRKLKATMDMTPTEFIRSIRLENAKKLLKTSHKTAQEIMYACGFSSKTYFYREFQKKYGMTPRQYRDSSIE